MPTRCRAEPRPTPAATTIGRPGNWSPLARRGNARALALLGFLYEHGFGEPQAYPAAADLYAEGAVRGDPFAQAMLGLMYDKGHGVPQDFVLAYKWLNLAAAHATGRPRDVYAQAARRGRIEDVDQRNRRGTAARSVLDAGRQVRRRQRSANAFSTTNCAGSP